MVERGRRPAGAPSGGGPDAPHLGRLEGVRFRPIFIMGSARSGTTILYRLLEMTQRFNCVTAYHLIDYEELLANHLDRRTDQAKQELARRFQELGIGGARFDGVEISPDFPEEYGFLLGDRQQLTPRTLPRFLELARKVQLIAEADRPLLLKNPWDSRRFLYIKKVFPDSRFIFIHRNPVEVVGSLLEGMRSLLRSRNAYHALLSEGYDRLMGRPLRRALARTLFSSRFGMGPRVVGWQVARTARYFLDNVRSLPEADHLSVRYEDLCQDPGAVIHRILAFLGLPDNHQVRYRDFIRVRERPGPPARDADPAAILRRMELKPYLAYCGYEAK
jgi:Sulfotransferase family